MYIDKICAAAEAMSGVDADTLLGAASVAEAEICSRLRPGVEASSIESQFIAAGALLTLAVYMTATTADGVSSYSAGNMSVGFGKNGNLQGADALRTQALMLLREFLSDDSFAFLGVDG